jgi:hypothetical protein
LSKCPLNVLLNTSLVLYVVPSTFLQATSDLLLMAGFGGGAILPTRYERRWSFAPSLLRSFPSENRKNESSSSSSSLGRTPKHEGASDVCLLLGFAKVSLIDGKGNVVGETRQTKIHCFERPALWLSFSWILKTTNNEYRAASRIRHGRALTELCQHQNQ